MVRLWRARSTCRAATPNWTLVDAMSELGKRLRTKAQVLRWPGNRFLINLRQPRRPCSFATAIPDSFRHHPYCFSRLQDTHAKPASVKTGPSLKPHQHSELRLKSECSIVEPIFGKHSRHTSLNFYQTSGREGLEGYTLAAPSCPQHHHDARR